MQELFPLLAGTAVHAGYLAAGCLAFDKVWKLSNIRLEIWHCYGLSLVEWYLVQS